MADEKLSKRKVPTRLSAEQTRKLVFSALDGERSSDEALSDEEHTGSITDEEHQITSDSDACGTSDNEYQAVAAEGPSYSLQQGNSVKIEFE